MNDDYIDLTPRLLPLPRVRLVIEVGCPPGATVEDCREVAQIVLDGSAFRYDNPVVTIEATS